MKTKTLLLLCLLTSFALQAQVSKTVNCTAGELDTLLTAEEKATITNLTLTGTIDERDFITMRRGMPLLEVIDMGAVTVAAYASNAYEGIIPNGAFQEMDSLVSVILPSTSVSIGHDAFTYCLNLTTVSFPPTITSIGSGVFYNCKKLSSLSPLPSLTYISWGLFSGCESLSSINIPASVTRIYEYAFYGCKSLTSIAIPSSVQNIEHGTFTYCSGLTSVSIPASVTYIHDGAFKGCGGLFIVDSANSNFSSKDGVLFDVNKSELIQCPTSKSGNYVIPSGTYKIGYYAFYNCKSLSTINLSGVSVIESLAFENCSGLIIVDPATTNFSCTDSVLFNKSQTSLIYCPNWKSGSYAIPASVKTIQEYAFIDCSSLSSVTLPESLTTIGDLAFYGCSSLSSMTLPETLTSIGEDAFIFCSGLTSINIPSSVTSIKRRTFGFCSSLTSIIIPSSVTTIEDVAFQACSGLTSVTAYSKTPINIVRDVFYGVDTAACILYVPYGSKSLYEAAEGWKAFKNIVEMAPSEITETPKAVEDVKIYPNPVAEYLNIEGLTAEAELTIFNTNGQVVMQQRVSANLPVSVGSLAKGVYYLNLRSRNGISVLSFVKN